MSMFQSLPSVSVNEHLHGSLESMVQLMLALDPGSTRNHTQRTVLARIDDDDILSETREMI